ncbi:MAG: hypothetical protein IPK75_18275 [Acidobacteria bacterium]|nr:hypothetical protein [Acidobacteriota bacterium]
MPPVNIEALTLPAALAIAVIALWRKLDQKDQVIAEALRILERSAEASEAVAEAMERLRASLPAKRKSPEP